MAIGAITSEQDLDRFIEERLSGLQTGDIAGLDDALAARAVAKVERFGAAEDLTLAEEEAEAIPGILFEADVAMEVYASTIFDIEGGAIFGQLLVNGAAEPQAAIGSQDAASSGTFGQDYALSLAAGDVVTLAASAPAGGSGKVYAARTALTIVRVS